MRNFFLGLAVVLFSLGGAVAQHGHGGGMGGGQGHMSSAPHASAPQQPRYSPEPRGGDYRAVPQYRQYRGYRGDDGRGERGEHHYGYRDYRGGDYRGWYGGRPEYRSFRWGHYYGWHYHPYVYLGSNYCYSGMWGGPYFTFGFNASRWRVLDFDLAIVNGWYPGGCDYVVSDPDHYGWYLLYDQQTGQYVHVEQY
jgi:hypothetical protein